MWLAPVRRQPGGLLSQLDCSAAAVLGLVLTPARLAQPWSRHDCTGSVSGAARDRLVCREPTREAPSWPVGRGTVLGPPHPDWRLLPPIATLYGCGSVRHRPLVLWWVREAPVWLAGCGTVLGPPHPRLLPPTDTQGRRGFAANLSFTRLGRL